MYKQHEVMAFFDFVKIDGKIWFYDLYNDAVASLDLETGETCVESFLPVSAEDDSHWRYGCIGLYRDKLILSPRNEKKILIYDMKKKSFKEILFDISKFENEEIRNLFAGVVIEGDMAYFLPGRYSSIIKLNLVTYELTYLDGWYSYAEPIISDTSKVLFTNVCQTGTDIYLPFWQGNKVLYFNLKNESCQWIHIAAEGFEAADVAAEGDTIWASDKNRPRIIKHNLATGDEIVIEVDGNLTRFEGGIYGLHLFGKWLYVLPLAGDAIVRIGTESLRQERFMGVTAKKIPELKQIDVINTNFICHRQEGNLLYLYSCLDAKIKAINLSTESAREYPAVLSSPADYKRAKSHALKRSMELCSNTVICENPEWNLEEFINLVNS